MVTTSEERSYAPVLVQLPATRRGRAWRALGSLIAVGGVLAWAAFVRPSDVGAVAYGIITVYVASIVAVVLFAAWSAAYPVDVSSQGRPLLGAHQRRTADFTGGIPQP
jgi:hypothetical protein